MKDGTTYRGEFQNQKRHGRGECTINDKYLFKGYWENGEIKRKGDLYDSNGGHIKGD